MKRCGFGAGIDQPLFLIAGPCVIEPMQLQLEVVCTLYNRFARERARRREAGARQIAFLTSLGHRLPGRRPSSDPKSQD